MTDCSPGSDSAPCRGWIPACAGMTEVGDLGDATGTELRSKCRQAPTGVALPGGCGTKPWSTGRGRLPVAHQVASQLHDVILRLLEYRRIGPPAARIVVTGTIHGIRSSSSVSKMRTAHDAQNREAWTESR